MASEATKPARRSPRRRASKSAERPENIASRGGLKLEGALEDFGIDVTGKTCLDIGASTGGFTDCLLQRGARRIYAVDVTPQQMAWRLDARSARDPNQSQCSQSPGGPDS